MLLAKKYLWVWSVLIVCGLLLWFFLRSGGGEDIVRTAQLDFTEVDEGAVVASVRATGRLSPVREIQVGSQISGIITELYVDFNSEVEENQLIAKLDTSTFDANVKLAEAELRRAEAAYELARQKKQRLISLRERDFSTQSDLDEAVASVRQAEAEVDIKKSNLNKAEIELARCFIVSPTSGIVISRNVDVGQTVAASLSAPVLFEIADDLTRMEIIANVPEADIGVLEMGQRVEFQVDAYRERRFGGNVIQIRNAPRVINNVVTYDAVIEVDNSELLLKPGMTAEVFIITQEVESAVRVRNSALRARLPEGLRPDLDRPSNVSEEARPVYLHGPDGTIRVQWIQTGISDGMYTEVREGLESGDRLITGFRLQVAGSGGGGSRSLLGGRQATF